MPANKDFKRLVRRRMRKTGESYTAARAQLLTQKKPSPTTRREAPDYAALAGRSDATLKARTGCSWERWVRTLDRVDAHTWTHRDIAKYVQAKYKVTSWWAQTVTVGYERIKGLRAIGQRRDGSFEATKSRTFAVPLSRLYQAVHDGSMRARWLPGVDLTVRGATTGKAIRITWPDRTPVVIGFVSRGTGKSQLAIQHAKLPDRAAVTRLKQFWTERLGALEQMLQA
jgi:hypothetical protein